MAPLAAPPASLTFQDLSSFRRAYRLLWLGFALLLATVVIGLAWDRAWHATHAFENFYSPPHLFIYGTSALTVALVAYLAFDERLRRCFGTAIRVSPVPFALPGALTVLAGGLTVLALAGLLDDIWHSSFGLDETGWSTPHAMLGWAWFATVLGFVACRLALRTYRPLSWPATLLLMNCTLAFSVTPFLGPLHANKTPETVRAVSHVPVFEEQAPPQHTFRIYEQWNLNQTNPLLIPLGALWCGAALALLRGLDRRARLWLGVIALFTLLQLLSQRNTARALDPLEPGLLAHPANWLPLPILPAALLFALLVGAGGRERSALWCAGWLFGLLVWLIWDRTAWSVALVFFAGPLLWLGATLGARVSAFLALPRPPLLLRLGLVPLCIPLLTGMVDLLLRHVTP